MKRITIFITILLIAVAAFALGKYSTNDGPRARASTAKVLYYVDPMHPSYTSSQPGRAPDCGMDLVPVREGESLLARLELPEGSIYVEPEWQRLIGVRVEEVKQGGERHLAHTTGRLQAEDQRVFRLTAATDGWVQSLANTPPGSIVSKGATLGSFYSRELRNAQQAYLGSLSSSERVRTGGMADDPNSVLRTNEEQLRALGMGEPQIKELAKKRQTTTDITLASPTDGVVLTRNISPAQRFEKGAELMSIGDLSKLWIEADLYADDLPGFRSGRKVKVYIRELSQSLYATVLDVPPLFDQNTRTLKAKLEIGNPAMRLRPGMFVDLEMPIEAPPGISIPGDAVLDSGLKKIVYVQTAAEIFEPRVVEVGASFGDRVIVKSGLVKGDHVVTAGNFLLDSESKLKAPSVSKAMPTSRSGPPMHGGHN